MNLLAVGAGGFVGAIIRYLIGSSISAPSGFPLGTLIINLAGCLFLAWFFTITTNRLNFNPQLKLAIGTGFTGAFTTFSTFCVETLSLIQNNQILMALVYVLISIFGGIALAIGGARLATIHVEVEPAKQTEGESE